MKVLKRDPNSTKLLFTFEAAARELGVHASLLKKAADRGQVAVVELGRRRLLTRAELNRLSGGAIGEL